MSHFGHIDLRVSGLAAALAFYDELPYSPGYYAAFFRQSPGGVRAARVAPPERGHRGYGQVAALALAAKLATAPGALVAIPETTWPPGMLACTAEATNPP
jgi:predicted enzyme related to lactoylglutathione lyase